MNAPPSQLTALTELIRQAKEADDPGLLPHAIPYTRWLGIDALLVDGALVGKLNFAERNVGNVTLPALHGGPIGALLESTAIFHLLWEAETVKVPKTINITVDFLRSARTVDTWASSVITRHGRRVANVRITAWQEDRSRPVAAAHAHFLLVPPTG